MSKRETPITRYYWNTYVGGLLLEEFCLVGRSNGCGGRYVDGLILTDREKRIANRGEIVDLEGQRVVLVQTKVGRLGMSVMGQTVFSAQLLRERFKPATILSVALCISDDLVLRPMLERHLECRVVVISGDELARAGIHIAAKMGTNP